MLLDEFGMAADFSVDEILDLFVYIISFSKTKFDYWESFSLNAASLKEL